MTCGNMNFLLFFMHNGLVMLERNSFFFFLYVYVYVHAGAHTQSVDASVYLSPLNIRVSSHLYLPQISHLNTISH